MENKSYEGDTTQDVVGMAVAPFLIYLGELGITPKVLAVEGEEVLTIREIKGQRLGNVLRNGSANENNLLGIYEFLGRSIGKISKYGIVHGHLHTDNVIIDSRNKPVIIDWGLASYLPIISGRDRFLSDHNNMGQLIRHTRRCLSESVHSNLGSGLESSLAIGFNDEYRRPLEFSMDEIYGRAEKLMYPSRN